MSASNSATVRLFSSRPLKNSARNFCSSDETVRNACSLFCGKKVSKVSKVSKDQVNKESDKRQKAYRCGWTLLVNEFCDLLSELFNFRECGIESSLCTPILFYFSLKDSFSVLNLAKLWFQLSKLWYLFGEFGREFVIFFTKLSILSISEIELGFVFSSFIFSLTTC